MRIFHIATRADWEHAQDAGSYEMSTIGRTLAEIGYIHAARVDQWPSVHRRYYADVFTPLILLEIETDLLRSIVIEEQPAPGVEAIYPHIYGPINTDAVVRLRDVTHRLSALAVADER